MLPYSERKEEVSRLLEKVLLAKGTYEKTPEWSYLEHCLNRTNEVSGIILYADHNYDWHSKTVLTGKDLKKEKERIKNLFSPIDIRHHYFYNRIGFTDEMYGRLNSIPKNLNGLDRLAILAKEYAENLSRTSADRKIIFYCGPVNATGGFMDLELNLEHLFRAIMKGASRYEPVFDQTVFESHLVEITKQVKENPAINQSIVLDRFYKPLYHNWLVKEMRFLFNWQTSGGAQWEMDLSKERRIPSVILPDNYVDLSFARKNAPQN